MSIIAVLYGYLGEHFYIFFYFPLFFLLLSHLPETRSLKGGKSFCNSLFVIVGESLLVIKSQFLQLKCVYFSLFLQSQSIRLKIINSYYLGSIFTLPVLKLLLLISYNFFINKLISMYLVMKRFTMVLFGAFNRSGRHLRVSYQ